jgi:tetratricopeptide (TPR) repeat protein
MSGANTMAGDSRRPTIWLISGLIGLALAGAASLWFVLQAAWADAGSLRARTTVTAWREGTGPVVTDELWERTRAQLQDALDTTPGNAQLHDDLAYIYAARSQRMGNLPLDTPEYLQQQSLMDEAISHYRTACALRPTLPYTWAYLALAKHYRGQHDAEFLTAYDHAIQFGHSEADLHITFAELTYSQWARLGPDRQQTFAKMAATAKESSRVMFRVLAERAGVELPAQQ